MPGQTLINTDLRNELVKFLDVVSEATFINNLDSHRQAVSLYNRLLPKRNRKSNEYYAKQKRLEQEASRNWI